MKEKLAGNKIRGFSTLEIVIALALMIVVIVGAVNANFASEYWFLTSETSSEALYKAKTLIERARALSVADFQGALSSLTLTKSEDPNDPSDTACINGGLCYHTQNKVLDISSCSKFVEAHVEWRLGLRYPSSTISLYTNLTNNNEIIALGGDCILNEPSGAWLTGSPSTVGERTLTPSYITGIDVLQKRIYLVASTSPQLRVFQIPNDVGQNPALLGSVSTDADVNKARKLNSVDAIRDLSTGRTYVYGAQHASTSQLMTFDATDASNPSLVSKRTLADVEQTGSYPEGWRVLAYNGRLYVVTRETTGPELHIFNINGPAQPSEIESASLELNRTVNDLIVREQIVNGSLRRLLFLAADADLKELSIFDVTDDAPSEIVAINLSGTADGLSLFLTGDDLYLGRQTGSEPELYKFSVRNLIDGDTTSVAESEVGARVETIRGTGSTLLVGTNKNNEEFQVWKTDTSTWSTTVANAGRSSATSFVRLAPLGIDLNTNWVYLISGSETLTELLKVMYTP